MARRNIDRLQSEIEELFADLWQVPRFSGLRHGFRPAVDCFVTDEPPQLVIVVELAGIEPDAIEIAVEGDALTIAGQRNRPRVDGQVYQQAEIEYGRFERTIQLDRAVDASAANVSYDAGMLRVALPVVKRKR
ncbi:MAG TPA: Hsp20/alpha crystallin family protein [Gaiellaceae bacterium]|jgi:HSP20 family molecular chaperone IbpA